MAICDHCGKESDTIRNVDQIGWYVPFQVCSDRCERGVKARYERPESGEQLLDFGARDDTPTVPHTIPELEDDD